MTDAQATLARFVLSGAVTAVAYLGLSLMFERVLQNPISASLVAYAIVVLLHFVLNNFYTFQQRRIDVKVVARYAVFIAVFALLNLVVGYFVRTFEWPTYLLYVANAVVSPMLSFVVMKSFVFVRPSDAGV